MAEEIGSKLKEFSLGIVTKKKPYGVDMIDVSPIEHFSLEQGKIVKDTRDISLSIPDIRGVSKPVELKGSAILQAKWIPYGNSNRDTAPDVNVNETVMIYKYADTNNYYWDTLFREPKLRRLEHVRFAFSNKPDGLEEFTPESSYWIEWSTAEKRIKIHTSDNDGEACKYDIELNTRKGTFEFKDSLGNSVFISSPAGILESIMNSAHYFKSPLTYIDSPVVIHNGETYTHSVYVQGIVKADAHPVPGFPTPGYDSKR